MTKNKTLANIILMELEALEAANSEGRVEDALLLVDLTLRNAKDLAKNVIFEENKHIVKKCA